MALAIIIAAMTNATVTNNRMRLIMRAPPPLILATLRDGLLRLYKEEDGTPFSQAHCQNCLFLLWGVPNLWLYTPNFQELCAAEVRRIHLPRRAYPFPTRSVTLVHH
jgi:hypothetical protein